MTEDAGVDAGVFLADVKKELMLEETELEEDTEDTVSTVLIVADLLGVGMGGRLFMVTVKSSVALDFGGGRGGAVCTGAASFSWASLSPLPTIHQRPEGLLSTLIASVFCESMSPVPKTHTRSALHINIHSADPRGGGRSSVLTAHVAHRDLEILPRPAVLAAVHVLHDQLELVEAGLGLVGHVVLCDLVPVLARDLALDAARFDLSEPVVDWDILLRVPDESWGILPLGVDGFELERLNLKCVQHREA